jgi:tRNA A-37 threonylcarbamoyl transferase component Bud32
MVQTRLPSRYRVIEEVGQGGMAVVYRAQDETLRREVAIKVLHAHLLSEPESKVRLQREAQAVAKLHHDNILQVFDYSGDDSLESYIVTEFIDGQTLKQFFSGRKTPQPEVAALIVIELGIALAHAHGLGILHRDLKPENVMVRRDGMLKLMDFGVAQIVDLERMTLTGQLLGSPAYMAPELFEGKPLDFRTDVFSLGIMLYQMATGALPFSGRNPHEVLKRIAEGRFPDPRTLNRLIADRLSRVIARALAKKPDDRYPTVGALVADLRQYVRDAGLDDVRDELRRFFTGPDAYERELPPRAVAGLVETGAREQTAAKLARALECWNRALALEPQNAAVLRSLRRIEGRRRIHRSAVVVGAAGLLGCLIWGAFKMARDDVPRPLAAALGGAREKARTNPAALKAAARTLAPVEPLSAPAPATRPAHGNGNKPSTHPSVQGRPALPKPAVPRPTITQAMRQEEHLPASRPKVKVFTVAPNPLGAEVWLDGRKVLKVDIGRNTLEIPWDREHVVEVRNDSCCDPVEFRVGPDIPRQEDRLIAQLPRKPAKLRVLLTPPPLTPPHMDYVTLPERPGSTHTPFTAGEELLISFDASGETRKVLLVSVWLEGKTVPVRKRVEISAGQNIPLEIPLVD